MRLKPTGYMYLYIYICTHADECQGAMAERARPAGLRHCLERPSKEETIIFHKQTTMSANRSTTSCRPYTIYMYVYIYIYMYICIYNYTYWYMHTHIPPWGAVWGAAIHKNLVLLHKQICQVFEAPHNSWSKSTVFGYVCT